MTKTQRINELESALENLANNSWVVSGNEHVKNNALTVLKDRQEKYDDDSYHEHSHMLGLIANQVEDWCEDGETTTYQAVCAMKAELFECKARELREKATL